MSGPPVGLSASERDNLTIWRPGRTGFYEVYYLKLNDPAKAFALWVRYTILAPGGGKAPVAELWAIAFDARTSAHDAGKATFPIGDLRISEERFDLSIGEARLHQAGLSGRVDGAGGAISWDLAFEPNATGLRHFPREAMYRWPVPKTKALSPNVDVRFSGVVRAGGREVRLEGVPGMQAHLYGTRHAESWVWLHANAWDGGERAFLEGLSARIKLGPLPLPALTLFALEWRGQRHAWNGLSQLLANESHESEPAWRFACEDARLRLEGEATAPHERFVGVRYEDPDGSFRFCRNTKIATLRLRVLERASPGAAWALAGELACTDAAALEFVSGTEHPRVRTRI